MARTTTKALTAPLLLLAAACAPEPPPLPTLVLVTLDTTRADHLATYGYHRRTDPHLERFAQGSRVFEAAVPSATWTLPSHVSMFSGLDPEEHGCWLKLEESGPEGMPTPSAETELFTAALRRAGYHQLAAVGGPFTSHRYGLLRDFDAWLDPGERWELPAHELNEWIFAALEERPRDRPLFLFVNYFDAHAPYDAPTDRAYPFPEEPRTLAAVPPIAAGSSPEPGLLMDAIDQYDRELLVQDEALGGLLARLEREGLLANALVVVTADHGEMFGEQAALYGHGCLPYEPVARVPLVVRRTPGGPVDRVAAPVSLANLPATFLAAAELPALANASTPRFDLLALPAELPEPYVEHRGLEQWVGVLRGARFKYCCSLAPERALAGAEGDLLLDLQEDPAESREAADGPGGEAVRLELRERLEALARRWARPPATLGRTAPGAHELEQLRALGYGGEGD